MKIDNAGYSKYISRSYDKTNISTKIGANHEEQKNKNNIATDSLEISSSYREISRYVEQIRSKDVDMDRVNYIKSAIEKGQYTVSSKELAGKIIDKIKEDL